MASESVESRATPATRPSPWLGRLGVSGTLLALGGLAGILVAFLPLAAVTVQTGGPAGPNPFAPLGGGANDALTTYTNFTVRLVDNWRGQLGMLGYVAAMILAFVLYPPQGLRQKALCWVGVGVGLLLAVLAIWLLILAFDNGGVNVAGLLSIKVTPGIGAFLNVVTAGVVAAGSFLKAREEKLV